VGFATVQRLRGLGIKVGEGTSVAWQRLESPDALRDQLLTAVAVKAGKVNG
jgi:trehalose 6-phosphate phosphatase